MDLSGLANGAKVYFELSYDLPDGLVTFKNLITQTTVSLFVSTLLIIILAAVATRKLDKRRPGKLQIIAEKLVNMLYGLVEDTMGKHNAKFAPYIGTLFLSSIVNTLIGMTNIFRSSTADLSVTAAWALVTTGMVWYHNIKNFGFVTWLKGFTEPIVVMTPMNIVSEIASPLSLAFRHFGNIAGGSVLTGLIYAALAGASSALFSLIPGAVGSLLSSIPVLQVGIPAVLSIYFDLFSGFVQALVFSLLTMVYVGAACPPPEELPERKPKKSKKA
ncbi:MAG: F0F1 ATP synthase subunit A [Clostridia bacterium]|nr:F0F1 ATP synthase subunit A [Clostridia bacterium]